MLLDCVCRVRGAKPTTIAIETVACPREVGVVGKGPSHVKQSLGLKISKATIDFFTLQGEEIDCTTVPVKSQSNLLFLLTVPCGP